jgi:hypothetical protein
MPKRDVIQEFYDWLTQEKGWTLCEFEDSQVNYGGFVAVRTSPDKIIAEFLGIDHSAYLEEREALYQELTKGGQP